MEIFKHDLEFFNQQLADYALPSSPQGLYEPVRYLLDLGGKRIRPLLVLAATRIFDGDQDQAIHPALAVEMFHNFSLMHDDIMDAADLRRGEPTVHTKYDVNTAILSGDVMLIYAYKLLMNLPESSKLQCLEIFNKMAEEVCVGQQMDMDFEQSSDVTIMDYLTMIELKTSVLIGAALQMGAVVAGANDQDAYHLYQFGKNVGIAFQVQDDILDTYGTTAAVGKVIGGDILNNKKTYLYLKACQLLSDSDAAQLRNLFGDAGDQVSDKVDQVKALYKASGVRIYADELKQEYKNLALSHLQAIAGLEPKGKAYFEQFADYLVKREV